MIDRRTSLIAPLLGLAFGVSRGADQGLRRIGVLFSDRTDAADPPWLEFVAELARRGYVEGRTIVFEKRYGDRYRSDLLEAHASELVAKRVDLIFVFAGTPGALAAKRATTVIPIVFFSSADPVGLKVVDSLARPGGNLTGSSNQNNDVAATGLQFFVEAVPALQRVTCVQPTGTRKLPWFEAEQATLVDAARRLGISFAYEDVASVEEIEPLLRRYGGRQVGVLVPEHPPFRSSMAAIASTCLRLKVPAMGDARKGFLLHYVIDERQLARKAADYVDRILKGAHPSVLPVDQASTFELVVNLRTARGLGLNLPKSLLARADEVVD